MSNITEYVLISAADTWGEDITEAEHEAACERAEAWLTAHEGDYISIRVRPARRGEIADLYSLRDGALGCRVDVSDLGHDHDVLEDLVRRALDHAVATWGDAAPVAS